MSDTDPLTPGSTPEETPIPPVEPEHPAPEEAAVTESPALTTTPETGETAPAISVELQEAIPQERTVPVPKSAAPRPISAAVPEAYLVGPDVEREMRRISRRSFLWGAGAMMAGFAGWKWLITREDNNGIPWPFRHALRFNERLFRGYFRDSRLAPTFPRERAETPKQNGDLGLPEDFDPAAWKLRVLGLKDMSQATTTEGYDEPAVLLTLDDIRALPKFEMVTELKCIEGWSVVVRWAGARLSDFMQKYPPPTKSGQAPDLEHRLDDLPEYVGLETPDGGYYVGLDRESAVHPQTLLCYEMNGQPLPLEHGAPLRLVIPVKYGIKHIKRIGTLHFTDQRPADYWAEQGYDWYAGH